MIIEVKVIVPDGRHCYDCDYLTISGYCALFRSNLRKYRNIDSLFDKCLACMNATRVEE
jgi:hypothetical protein